MRTAVVVDLDGTVRDTRHRHHMIDRAAPGGVNWDAYSEACAGDTPVPGAVRLVRMLAEQHLIIVVSGAQDVGWDQTVAWLRRHDVPYHALMMRTPDEKGIPNPVLKARWVKERLADVPVVLAVDDHPGVAEAFAELGIPTLLVASDGVQGRYDHLGDAHGYAHDAKEPA